MANSYKTLNDRINLYRSKNQKLKAQLVEALAILQQAQFVSVNKPLAAEHWRARRDTLVKTLKDDIGD